uniref:Protein pelota homolog n=1 Tax=Onchocerca volvulus TaxID=6282 RepID=A0A8R1U0K8_ONCVO
MKQFKRNIDKNGAGEVTLLCDDAEDMWHVYNLVRIGDEVRCTTVRKVTMESNTGSTSSQRVHIVLSIAIETVDFDPIACILHLKGRNIAENKHVKMGQYHTLDIDAGKKFQLWKSCWDSIDLDRLDLAIDPSRTADVAAIVMHEGLANLCLVTAAMTIVKAKIDMQIPRKKKGFSNQHDKGIQRFYEAIAAAFVRHVDMKIVKCILIASRGFLNEQFLNYLMDYADKHGNKLILESRSKFLLAHASSGFKHALKEVLSDPGVAAALSDTKAQAEVKALNMFYDLMGTDPARAFYGYKHVLMANEQLAIDTLLLSDSLFRSNDIHLRKKYVELAESVKEQATENTRPVLAHNMLLQGSNVLIFSSMHVSGEQLSALGGVAAILRFPLHELEDEEMSDSEHDENNGDFKN